MKQKSVIMKTLYPLLLLFVVAACKNPTSTTTDNQTSAKSVDYVFTCDLKDSTGVKEKYAHYHSAAGVWPEVKQAAKESGANSIKVLAQGNRLVLIINLPKDLSFEEFDKRYNTSSPKMAEWDKIMSGYQTAPPGADKNQTWVPMETLYDSSK